MFKIAKIISFLRLFRKTIEKNTGRNKKLKFDTLQPFCYSYMDLFWRCQN